MTNDPTPRGNLYPPQGAPAPQQWGPAPQSRPPFSRTAIWGFVIGCVGLFVFGFMGVLAVTLSARGLRKTRTLGLRGRGLAVAGIVLGLVDFLYYAFSQIVLRHMIHS